MRITFASFAFAACVASAPAFAASTVADVLAANKSASSGAAWDGKQTLLTEDDYSGQGMTGKVSSRTDLVNGYWIDSFAIGPATGANGFDGAHAWEKDPSGAVTNQDGGEQRELAVNEGYRRANRWWRSGFGDATIVADGQKTEGGASYDVLTVTPKDGKNFDAWFDAQSHLLTRIVEMQGTETDTTTLSDYRAVDGVQIAFKTLVNNGNAKYDQTMTATGAKFGPAQDQSSYAAPKVVLADTAIAGGAKQTTFPFHLYNNHIYADVKVNGKGPYQFIFDTGGVNVLTPPVVAELGLKSEGQMQGNGAGSGHMDFGVTKVSSLQLGGATVKDQVFAVAPLNSFAAIEGVGMPGMIGFEVFTRFVTRVDYGAGTLTFIKPDAFDPKDAGVAVPFTFNGNTIEVPGSYDGIAGNFTIDTGSRGSLSLNAPFVAKNGLDKSGKGIDAVTGWGIGGPTRSVALRGATLRIGTTQVTSPVVELSTDKAGAMADAAISGNIGAGILKRFVVTLDYGRTTLYLKPLNAPMADLDTFDRAGMWFNEGSDGYKIVDVTKGAPADAAGLKVDDQIVAVDGKPAKSIPLYEMRRRLRDEPPGTVVTFTVKGKGDVRVTLRDLI